MIKNIFYIFLSFYSIGYIAFADELQQREDVVERSIIISKNVCSALINHIPDEDVSYNPYIDAGGYDVLPADIKNNQLEFKSFNIPVAINLEEKYDFLKDKGISFEYKLGDIKLKNGIVYFNDKAISLSDSELLVKECQKLKY